MRSVARHVRSRWYDVLIAVAAAWALGNCVYVYLWLEGAKAYRVESAVLIFAAVTLPRILANERVAHGAPATPAWRGAIGAAIVLALAAIYLPLLHYPFLSDDYVFLGELRTPADILHPWQFFRPVFAAVFVLLRHIGNEAVEVFRAGALVLHLTSSVLVYGLARRMALDDAEALLAATIFALSPIQLEAVLWVSGLQELLWVFFLLSALYVYTADPVLSLRRAVATIALLAGALGSKETAVCFVLLVPAVDGLLFRWQRGRVLPFAYAACAGVLLGYVMLRQRMVAGPLDAFQAPTAYGLKQLLVIPYDVFLTPWNAGAVGSAPTAAALIAALAIVSLGAATLWGLTSRTLAGPFLILAATVPLGSYFFVGEDLQGARYLYLPAAGWGLLVACVGGTLLGTPTRLALATVGVAALSLTALHQNAATWHTAGAIVRDMERAIRDGQDVRAVTSRWQQALGRDLIVGEGIPREYRGVVMFRNGYEVFVARTATRGSPQRQRPQP